MTNPAPKNNLFHELLQILSSEGSQALPQIIRTLLNQSMLLERETALEAAPYERTSSRKGYANGFKPKTIHTPLGSICVDVPQVRGDIDFYPSALERHSRTEKALLLAMAKQHPSGANTDPYLKTGVLGSATRATSGGSGACCTHRSPAHARRDVLAGYSLFVPGRSYVGFFPFRAPW